MSKVKISSLIRHYYKGIKQIIKLQVDFSFCRKILQVIFKVKFEPCVGQVVNLILSTSYPVCLKWSNQDMKKKKKITLCIIFSR